MKKTFFVLITTIVAMSTILLNVVIADVGGHPDSKMVTISPERINSLCSDQSLAKGGVEIIKDPENEKKIIGSLKCSDDVLMGRVVSVFGEKSAQKSFRFEGQYLQSLMAFAESIVIDNAYFPHSLKIKAKELTIQGDTTVPVDLDLKSEKLILNKGKLVAKQFNVNAQTIISNLKVESEMMAINATNFTLQEEAVLSTKQDLTLLIGNKLSTDGIIRSLGDLSITAATAELTSKAKIFTNGVYRLHTKKSLNDRSTTIARLGASLWASSVGLLEGFSFTGDVLSVVADSVNVKKGVHFIVAKALISTRDEQYAKVQFGGTLLSSNVIGSSQGMRDTLQAMSSKGWFKAPQNSNLKSNTTEFKSIKGVQFISHSNLSTESTSLIESDYATTLQGQKMTLQGKISTSGTNNTLMLQALEANIEGKLSSAQGILIDVTNKLDIAAEMMAKESIVLFATDLLVRAPSVLTANTNVEATAKGSVTINGSSSSGVSTIVTADGRLEVHGDHTATKEMALTSTKDKVVMDKDSNLTYETGTFRGAHGVEFNGRRSGINETIDSPKVKENGKVVVETTTYVYPDSEITFSGSFEKSKMLKIVNAKKVEFLKGSDIKSDLVKIKSTNIDFAKDSSVEGERVDL
ncbi:MAG: hypothetical protein HQK50_05410, partial [Oligoflexia bacterium]|nr:hypothetical protein [Oligoflexia bacterium]